MDENGKNGWLKVLIVILIVVIGFVVFANFFGFGMMGSGMMGGMMGFGWPFMLLPVILIIVIVYAILDRDRVSYYDGENPMQVLERRYANGEISRGNYLRMKEDIEGKKLMIPRGDSGERNMNIWKKKIVISSLIAIAIGAVLVIGPLTYYSASQYSSNGERIYYMGVNKDGERIPYSGGMMMRMSCADCHGDTGEGGFYFMMYDATSTDIRYDVLTETHTSENESEDGHHDHIPYNDTTIKAAITKGLEPDGEQLSLAMPRWRLSDEDLNDLLDYLKTLNSSNTDRTGNTGGSGMMGRGMMDGTMEFGWLFMLLPIILIIILIYALSGRETHEYSQPPYTREESPMEALERRYASGEIGREEYFRMKKDMRM